VMPWAYGSGELTGIPYPSMHEPVLLGALAAIRDDGSTPGLLDPAALASAAFAAVDHPPPGGHGWEELDRLATTAARSRRCRGTSVSIRNPALDPDGIDARNVVDFLSRLVERCPPDLATL
jgi:hypothetical protein